MFLDTDDGMAPIRDSLNDAIEEITTLTGSNKRTYIIPLRSETNWYRIDMGQDRFAWVTDLWLTGIGRRLVQKDFLWLINYNPRWMINTGTPERYVPLGKDLICVHPAPSGDSDTLELTAVVVPDRYTSDEQRVKLRGEFHQAAVNYAVGEYWASRGDAKSAKSYHNIYLKKLGIIDLYPETAERHWQYKTEKTVQ